MTSIYDDKGNYIPCTIIDTSGVKVVGLRTSEKDGYEAIILGIGQKKKPTKNEKRRFKNLKMVPEAVLEIRKEKLPEGKECKIGDEVTLEDFSVNDTVNITAKTKGKGFQGVVKRWRFKGGPRTRGQSDRERHGGSIGAGTDPGRVFKGKKMPGHMGQITKTVLRLPVVKVDNESNILCVKGAVPGCRNEIVRIIKDK